LAEREHVTETKSPVLEDFNSKSNKLYILFGGIAAAMGMPPFEFYNSSRIIKENKIFLRDFSQSWYQCGLPGIGETVYDICNYLDKKINQIDPDEVFFVGNSMGGFAAILFAALLEYGKAIAFCPQTFISPFRRFFYGDWRWKRQIFNMYKATLLRKPRPIYDLKKILSGRSSGYIAEIYVSRNDRLDLIHAKRIEELKCICVHKYDVAGHNLVKYFRDNDQLQAIMEGIQNNG
jgi:pimeloyl-ACP methyl ester carboxylesterase